MMTLDEAIIHAKAVAEFSDRECMRERFYGEKEMQRKCAEEHRQLAEWLKELKECREKGEPKGLFERNKDKILQAGMEGKEIELRIGGRLFRIREVAQ